jgi:hypothetical protein
MSIPGIDKGDWRLQTTSHLTEDWNNPWTGVTVAKGTRITVVSVIQLTKKKQITIPIPNATASMLNASARAFDSAKVLRNSAQIDSTLKKEISFSSETDAIDYIERMMESIVLAYSAIEAFANETVPSDFIYARHRNSDIVLEASNKETIERNTSTDEKLTIILPEIIGCKSPKGGRCWQGYKQLKSSRDRIIHMKTQDRKSSRPEIDTVWKAIVLAPTPHIIAKEIIEHFIKSMSVKPQWYTRFLEKN